MATAKTAEIILSSADGPTLELAIAAWLDAKHQRSYSARTLTAYTETLASFRRELRGHGLDLDGDGRAVALVAQRWAAHKERQTATPLAGATFNQRLAIISSFYQFARKRQLLTVDNPIALLDRRPSEHFAAALPLDFGEVEQRLAAIDRTQLDGLRDDALLRVALTTGRRAAELAGLCWGDLARQGNGRILVTWRRCKGGKVMHDELGTGAASALMRWLDAAYGTERLATLAADAPVWLALDRRSAHHHDEHGVSAGTIADICMRRLGTSKVHATRHTFAVAMEESGATVSEIAARLGHSSIATTGEYLKRLRSATNPHVARLEALLGVSDGPQTAA